jgi:hypothetical protein
MDRSNAEPSHSRPEPSHSRSEPSLSRRDALAALSALGMSATAGCAARAPRESADSDDEDGGPEPAVDPEGAVETYVAVAEVVYPSAVSGVEEFVRSFVSPRLDREDHGPAMLAAVAELQDAARTWNGEDVASMSPETREQLLRELGVGTAEEDPHGTAAERVRFYVVNELLLALYSSPTGGELVGIENPQGHPGGTDTYQRGPPK